MRHIVRRRAFDADDTSMPDLETVECDETTVSTDVRRPLAPDSASTSRWCPVDDEGGSPTEEKLTDNEASCSIQVQEDEHRTSEGKTERDGNDELTENQVDSLSTHYSHISRGQRVAEANVATTGCPGQLSQGSTSFRNGRHRKALMMDTRVTSRTPIRCAYTPRLDRGRHQPVILPYPVHPGWNDSEDSDDATQHLDTRSHTLAESRNLTKLRKALPHKVYDMSPALQESHGCKEYRLVDEKANFRDSFRPDISTEYRPKYYSNHVHHIKNTCESRVAHRENRKLFGRGKVNDVQVMHRRDNRKPSRKHKLEAKIFPMVHSQPQKDLTHKGKVENLTVLQRQQHKGLLVVHTEENEDLPMAENKENDNLSLANTQENKDLSVVSRGENKNHPGSFECHECGFRYKSKTALQKHLAQFSKNADERIFKCYFCSHSYASRKYRNKHERIHGKSRSLPCCCCDRTFSNRDTIQRHRMSKNIKMPPECVGCGWVFASKGYLDDHLLKVQRDLPFQCFICSHNYPSELALVKHVRFHGRKKEFECASCTARFVNGYFLKRHIVRSRRRTSLEKKN
ncbi:uncharacterized protein [Panulirus ornatus]|uniref:uncharacterized protein n=1 Tax=Panulirus ornatus TaxID=150431 RepID=UPI003A8C218E